MTLGFVQAGHTLVGKMEQQGSDLFMDVVDANRHLVGDKWEGILGSANWEPRNVPVVFGNPPCSGFSMMSVRAGAKGGGRGGFRGIDASINSCMWDLVAYGAACKPEVLVMESVPSAGSDSGKAAGRPLMRALRDHMEELTGDRYYLTHAFHNSLRLGGSSERRRYFMVLSRSPFSVAVPRVERMPLLTEVVGDLPHNPDPSARVAYAGDASWWAESRRNADNLVDGNATFFDLYDTAHGGRLYDAIDSGEWAPGEHLGEILQRYYEREGTFPGTHWTPSAQDSIAFRPMRKQTDYNAAKGDAEAEAAYAEKWETGEFPPSCPLPFQGGAYMPKRWRPEHHAHVIAGNALWDVVHPTHDRTFTYREAARIMGFPDNWNVEPYWQPRNGSIVYGKGVVVDSGRWIGQATAANVNGETLEDAGELVGDREYLIKHQNLGRDVYAATYTRRAR